MIAVESLNYLTERGVRIPAPEQVWIDADVDPERIAAPNAVLYPGCRIRGDRTFLAPGARLGEEGPVTVVDSRIGPGASVCGGFCREAVLLAGASLGSAAHVRAGTLLEEGARTAHAVGLKQTILFPFVTLGSLINFCDVLMAGGTDRRHHSEVGSSFIHFNFTPNQDKATASLLGDVPEGVLIRRPPIFLGGQGGLVGPCRLAYGTVTAAGTVVRKDEARPGRLIVGGTGRSGSTPYRPGGARGLGRIVINNLIYIGNLFALGLWYRFVRVRFIGSGYPRPLHAGAMETIASALDERVRRLAQFCETQPEEAGATGVAHHLRQADILRRGWPAVADTLAALRAGAETAHRPPEGFLEAVARTRPSPGGDYIATIQALSAEACAQAADWLQAVVDDTLARSLAHLPGFQPPDPDRD